MGRKKLEIVKGFKATNSDMTCNPNGIPFKYELGKEYKEEKANLCNNGFHFCENPLDILNYYDLCESKFFEVEAKEVSEEKNNNDTKRVAKRIKLTAELGIPKLIKAGFDYIKEQCEFNVDDLNKNNIKNDDDCSKVATSGYNSKVATSGYNSKVATSGDYSKVATSGYNSQVATSGDYSKVATSGNYSQVATSGDCSQVATSGDYSQVATSGDYSQVATSGYNSQVATSGDCSKVATSGNYSQVATSGYNSKVATSGDYSKVAIDGEYSVGMCAGYDCKIKGKKGNWITLAEWQYDNEIEKYIPICVKSVQIDGQVIKEDTYYRLKNGEFIEC